MNRFKRILQSILTRRPNWLRKRRRFQAVYYYYDPLGVQYVLAAVWWYGHSYTEYIQGQGVTTAEREVIERYNKLYRVYIAQISSGVDYSTYTLKHSKLQKDPQNDRH